MEYGLSLNCVNITPPPTPNITSEHRFYTYFPEETYSSYWTLPEFSKVSGNEYLEISTTSNSTKWRVLLDVKNKYIYLVKYFGPEVSISAVSKIITINGVIEQKSDHFIKKGSERAGLMELPPNLKKNLKNDVFEFHFAITMKGNIMSHKTSLTDFKSIAQKKIAYDLKNMFFKQVHCDTTICYNEEKIEVHRAILCARSPFFDKMFGNGIAGETPMAHTDTGISADVFKSFILFLYTGEVDLSFDKAIKLYRAAVIYEVEDLRKLCSKFLVYNLTQRQFSLAYDLALEFKDEILKNEIIQFYRKLPAFDKKVVQEWKELRKKYPDLPRD